MTYLSLEAPRALETAISAMQRGSVVAFPTDTVYGLGASLAHEAALARIFDIKGRTSDKPLPILVAHAGEITKLSDEADGALLQLAARFWPGPLTIILKARPELPPEVKAPDGTIGVRVPDHSVALTIAQRNGGAIATTSANRSGQPPACTAEEIRDQLGGDVDVILDGGIAPCGLPSTVIRREGDTISVVREGAISTAVIQDTWRSIHTGAANLA
jgi:L-threonylcarbamoyladenylate synthase